MKKKGQNRNKHLFSRSLLYLYALVVVFPFVWMLYTSFKTSKEFLKDPWALPLGLNFENYINAWNKGNFSAYAMNSGILLIAGLVLITVFATTSSYVLARKSFRGRKLITAIYMVSMLFPSIVGLTPIYLRIRELGLTDNLFGLLLVMITAYLPFSIFIMIGYFKIIPKEYEEAAVVDGCSDLKTFLLIMFPMAKTGVVTICIFNFIYIWNDYPFSLILLSSDEKKTIQLGLMYLTEVQKYRTDWGALFAGLVIVMIPLCIVYALFQSRITEGLTTGGLKG